MVFSYVVLHHIDLFTKESFMNRIGFDNDKYLSMQSAHIRERIAQFGDKLYLEF